MCNDLGAVLLTESGKQVGCYSWNLKQKVSFPLKPELPNFGTAESNRFTLGKKKKSVKGFFYYIIYLFYAFQTMATCISHAFYLISVEMLTLLIKSLINPNLNPFSQARNKETLSFFFGIFFGWLVIFSVVTVTFFSMCNLAISPQAFNSTQKNSAQIMPDNAHFSYRIKEQQVQTTRT